MLNAECLSKRLKICSYSLTNKFYLESDREDFEKFRFNQLGELKIIEIISSAEIPSDDEKINYGNFKKIYYYSKSKNNKKMITSNLGAKYEGKLLLETFRENFFLEDIDMVNIGCNHENISSFKERKKQTFNKHVERIKNENLELVSIGDAIISLEYLIRGIKNSY